MEHAYRRDDSAVLFGDQLDDAVARAFGGEQFRKPRDQRVLVVRGLDRTEIIAHQREERFVVQVQQIGLKRLSR